MVELRVRVEEGEVDPVALEAACRAKPHRGGRELYRTACEAVELGLLAARPRRTPAQGPRWLATTMGRVRIERWRVKPPGGGSFHFSDYREDGVAC